MSRASVLARGKVAANAGMTSRCAVMRKTGDTTTVSALEVPEWATVDADSPVRIAESRGVSPSRVESIGGTDSQESVREAHFPHGTAIADGDLIEVTSGDCDGLVFRVVEGDPADQQTARRVRIVATRRPSEWA